MSRWRTALRWATLVPLLVLAGCATQPGISRRPAPDWVVQPPAASGEHELFVAAGSDPTGDVEAAEAQAAGSLLTQINQALGVDVTVLTTAEARSTLDSYEASVLQQVTQSGSGRVEGFRVADRYIDEQDGRVTVHLLGEYERAAFLAERAERRALLASREALLLAPEREADSAAASGRTGGAILGYLQAADAAARAEDGLRIAPVVLERSLQKAVSIAEGLSIEALSGPGQTRVGTSPTEPLRFAVRDAAGRAVEGLTVELSYAEPAGRTAVIRRVTRVTGDDGDVSFAFPIVEQAGRVEVTARIDLGAAREILASLPDTVRSQRAALENLLAAPRARWRFDAVSLARSIPTTIVIVETDASGAPMQSTRTLDGITGVLVEAGFELVTNSVDRASLSESSREETIRSLQNTLPSEARRVVYGTATIADFAEGDGFLVKVSATVTVVDLNTGQVIYSTSAVKNARSSSGEQAMNTAFLQLGRSIGEELSARLP